MPINFLKGVRRRARDSISGRRPRSLLMSERLTPEHILAVELQPAQAATADALTREYAEKLCAATRVGWAIVEDGKVLGCGGLVECWENRAQTWALISSALLVPRRFRLVHRMVRRVLDDAPWRRIEMDVDASHAAGIAWAEHLGFERECVRRKYTAAGRDMLLFARTK
ncbi:GNAT family N-acetyltransferase [Burkholderia pseudomallei]|uniref:GNAT family N-acetyltransferase n=2 Tax=Burkholderia pseudomallei TaxID=28450 RepID=UPI001E627D88|nr:GNAT family N-acetyltransferase [Burkholderia pseudomallei]